MKPKFAFRSHPIGQAIARFAGLAAVGLLGSQSVQAANKTWSGTTDQTWSTGTNWGGTAPVNADVLLINLSTGNFPIITSATAAAFKPGDVSIGTASGNTGRLDIRSGTLVQNVVGTAGNWMFVGANTANAAGGNGTLNLADTSVTGQSNLSTFGQGTGGLTVGKLWVGGRDNNNGTGTVNINTTGIIATQSTGLFASNKSSASVIIGSLGGTGTLNMDSGTINNASMTDIAFSTANTQATKGTLNLAGGTFNSEGDFRMGYAGSSAATAAVNLTGGTLNVGSATKRWMIVGVFDSTNSTVTVNSGNLNLNTNTDIRFKTGGNGAGTNAINLNGGAITSFSDNHVTANGTGVVDLMNAASTATNTFNLNGGTLTINAITATSLSGTRVFNFNGGTLKATGTNTAFFGSGVATTANVKSGGALINTNGFDVTIGQTLVHDSALGATADGGLTKSGNGALTLSAANTFTGATSVNAGSLLLTSTGSLATSGVTVAGIASLGGSGSIAGSVTSAGQLLPGGPSTVGTLTIGGGLSLSGGNIALDLNGSNNATGGGTNDLLAVTGNVSLSGLVIISPSFSSTPAASTSYTFATYTGSLTGGSNLAAGSRAITLDTATAGQLKLTYTGAASGNLNWNSTSSSAWDVVNTLNWTNTATSSTDRFYQNDTVTFDNTSGLQTSVVLSTTILPGSVVVNSDSSGNNYTFSGTGGLGGSSSLTKSGSSTLTLGTANTYTGATSINGGTVQLDGSLGSTAISVASGATLNESSTGSIGGAASLTVAGTATLSGTNTYSGATTVNSGGSLSVNSSAALGGAGSSLTLNNGTLTTTNTGLFTNGARAITIGAGGGTININSTGTAGTGQLFINTANTLLGSGALTITGNGNLGSSGAGNFRVGVTNTFNGSITLQSGGSFEYGVTNAVASATTVSLGNEGEIISNNNAVPLNVTVTGGTNSTLSFANGSTGSYTGGVTLNANGTVALRDWYNPATVRSGTISGVVSGTGGLTVLSGSGTGGTLTLGGVNTFTGDITANGSSNVTIGAAGKLGNGSYAGNIAMNGGTFTYGGASSQTLSGVVSGTGSVYASGAGTLTLSGANTFTGKTTINAGGVLSVSSLNSVTGGSTSSSLGAPITLANGTIDMTGVGGNGTLIYTGSGETTDRVINLAAGANAGLSAVIDQSGSGNLKFTSNLTATGAQTHTLVLKGSTSGTGEIAGAIVDNSGTNKTSVTKEGSGTWNLSGNSTYTGATTVSAGTLYVNGSLGNTAVTVNGGTLGGTATIGTSGGASLTVNTGATLAPGNSPGTLVINGNTTLSSGSTYAFQYTGGGTAADLVDVNGTLTIASGALLTLQELGTYSVGDKFTLFSYDDLSGSFDAYTDGNTYTFNGGDWLFNYADTTAGLNGGVGTKYITITAVPEPSALLLTVASALGLAFRRRRLG